MNIIQHEPFTVTQSRAGFISENELIVNTKDGLYSFSTFLKAAEFTRDCLNNRVEVVSVNVTCYSGDGKLYTPISENMINYISENALPDWEFPSGGSLVIVPVDPPLPVEPLEVFNPQSFQTSRLCIIPDAYVPICVLLYGSKMRVIGMEPNYAKSISLELRSLGFNAHYTSRIYNKFDNMAVIGESSYRTAFQIS